MAFADISNTLPPRAATKPQAPKEADVSSFVWADSTDDDDLPALGTLFAPSPSPSPRAAADSTPEERPASWADLPVDLPDVDTLFPPAPAGVNTLSSALAISVTPPSPTGADAVHAPEVEWDCRHPVPAVCACEEEDCTDEGENEDGEDAGVRVKGAADICVASTLPLAEDSTLAVELGHEQTDTDKPFEPSANAAHAETHTSQRASSWADLGLDLPDVGTLFAPLVSARPVAEDLVEIENKVAYFSAEVDTAFASAASPTSLASPEQEEEDENDDDRVRPSECFLVVLSKIAENDEEEEEEEDEDMLDEQSVADEDVVGEFEWFSGMASSPKDTASGTVGQCSLPSDDSLLGIAAELQRMKAPSAFVSAHGDEDKYDWTLGMSTASAAANQERESTECSLPADDSLMAIAAGLERIKRNENAYAHSGEEKFNWGRASELEDQADKSAADADWDIRSSGEAEAAPAPEERMSIADMLEAELPPPSPDFTVRTSRTISVSFEDIDAKILEWTAELNRLKTFPPCDYVLEPFVLEGGEVFEEGADLRRAWGAEVVPSPSLHLLAFESNFEIPEEEEEEVHDVVGLISQRELGKETKNKGIIGNSDVMQAVGRGLKRRAKKAVKSARALFCRRSS